jgi:HEAT repeat protein
MYANFRDVIGAKSTEFPALKGFRDDGERTAFLAELKKAKAARTHYAAGKILELEGNFLEALVQYDRALTVNRDDPLVKSSKREARFRLAVFRAAAALEKGSFYPCIRELRTAIGLKPKSGFIYRRLGDAYAHFGLYPKAAREYLQAFRVDPRYREARRLFEAVKGRQTEASPLLKKNAAREHERLQRAARSIQEKREAKGEVDKAAASRRKEAAEALAEMGAAALPWLLKGARDENPELRYSVGVILGRIDHPDGGGAILELLKDEESRVRLAATRSAARRKLKEAFPLLLVRAEAAERREREEAVSALGLLGDKRATEYLMQLVERSKGSIRQKALKSLGFLRDERAIPLLLRVLSEGLTIDSYLAHEALADMSGLRVRYDLKGGKKGLDSVYKAYKDWWEKKVYERK